MPYEQAKQSTPQEIKEQRRRCQWQGCNKTKRLEDWKGGQHCLYHWWYCLKYDGGNKWFTFKTTKLIIK